MNELVTVKEAASYCHVSPNALYAAIKKGRLPYHVKENTGKRKEGKKIMLTIAEVDAYRVNKYNRDLMECEGQPVFSLEKGLYSVNQVAKILGAELGRPFTASRVYYLIYSGHLKASRKRSSWVITREDAQDLLMRESRHALESIS